MKKHTIFTLAFLIISTFSFAQYTLQDADVVVTNGVIISCNITNFDTITYSNGNIIIPQILDGDTVKGIADGFLSTSVFKQKNISSLTLPASIQTIGNWSFWNNNISSLDLSSCSNLQSIGDRAFWDNNISNLDLSNCTALQTIGKEAFISNSISSLDLGGCTTLQYIGDYAFNGNSIASLDLSSCTALKSIGSRAFYGNSINYLNLNSCTALISIGEKAFQSNYISNLDLSSCTALQTIDYDAFTSNSITSLNLSGCIALQSIGGFNDNSITSLDLSTCSALISIKNGAFYNNSISIIDFSGCTALQSIGQATFSHNSISNLDLSGCTALQTIDYDAFSHNLISSLDLSACTALQTIEELSFYNNSIDTLDLSACTALQTIEGSAFESNTIKNLNLSMCIALQTIRSFAFSNNSIDSINLSSCTALQTIESNVFYNNSIDTIDLSTCTALKYIGNSAFDNNNISSFNLPIPNIPAYNFNNWKDSDSNTYSGGATVSNLQTKYIANLTATGSKVTFEVKDLTTNSLIQFAVIDLGIYGTRTSNYSGIAVFESVNDTINLPYTISKDGYTSNGNITIADTAITENASLCQLHMYYDTLVICNSELPYSYYSEIIPIGTPTRTITYLFPLTNGCDNTVNLNLTIKPPPNLICPQDIYTTSSDIINLIGETPQGGVYSGVGVSNNKFNPAGLANGTYTITYTYKDPITLCEAFCEFDINLGTIGIINSENNIECNIYPNPTSDVCKLNLSLEESQEIIIRLVNSLGQEMEYRKLNSSKEFIETFDFSGMASGIYSILINVGDKLITKRVIIK